MTTLFAAALAVGGVGVLVWVIMTALASSGEGSERADPERRWGATGRVIVAALFGFGLAGLSATYAGWSSLVSLLAAIAGGAALGWLSTRLGPQPSR